MEVLRGHLIQIASSRWKARILKTVQLQKEFEDLSATDKTNSTRRAGAEIRRITAELNCHLLDAAEQKLRWSKHIEINRRQCWPNICNAGTLYAFLFLSARLAKH